MSMDGGVSRRPLRVVTGPKQTSRSYFIKILIKKQYKENN